jgi:Tol biopolymer transport system component
VNPDWSPDGKAIVFASQESFNDNAERDDE